MKETSINIDCSSCDGTGLYRGLWEKPDEAVVCVRCSGSGMMKLVYREFVGRKERADVAKIRVGSGLIVDDAPKHEWFSYEEFKRRWPTPGHMEYQLTAREWDLYGDAKTIYPECSRTKRAEQVASILNVTFNSLLAEKVSKTDMTWRMHAEMRKYHPEVGSFSARARTALENLIDRAYPNE